MGLREDMMARLQAGAAADQARADAFRRKVLGPAPTLASSPAVQAGIDRGEHLLGTLSSNPYVDAAGGPLGIAANAAGRALGTQNWAPGRGPGGPDDLSQKAQTQLRMDDAGARSSGPMNTPLAEVQAAPTLASQEKPRPQSGVGGGGGDGGLKARYDEARRAGIRTLEEERELTGMLGADKAGRIMGVAQLNEQEAARQQAEAEQQRRIDQEAASKHEAFIARNEQLADEIGKMKIDPNRMMRSADANTRMGVAIGGILGGGLAALNGGTNTSLDRLDKMIDRDIRAQESEIDNKKASLSARNTVFGQMMQETGDRRLAAQQTRVMMLEAAKLKIQADSDRLGIPEVRTNAELATNGIQQKIDAAKTQMAKEAYELFQRQAAAAAAARAHAEQQAWERMLKLKELGLKDDELKIKAFEAGIGPDGKPIPGAGKAAKEDNAAIGTAVKQLADDKIVGNRELINRMAGNLRADGSVVGFDAGARAKKGLVKGLTLGLAPETALNRLALSDAERLAQKDWEALSLAFQTKITGTGGSDEQMQRIKAAYEGAGTTAERRAVILDLKKELERREDLARANLTDDQKAELNRRLAREGQK